MKKGTLVAVLCLMAVIAFAMPLTACSKTETPPLITGTDTVITSVKKTAKDSEAETAVFAALGKLENSLSYTSESSGTVIAKKGFINYTQISVTKNYKHGDEFFSDNVSESAFVKLKHEAFYKNGGVAYRVSGGEITNVKLADYKEVYGVTPHKLLAGHVFNQETIISAKLESVKNGLYTYSLVLDKDSANVLLKRQMKEFGNLGGYPSFTSDTKAKLVMKEDFTPVSYSYESYYKISVAILGNMDCTEKNSITYADFNEEVSIPDTDKFNAALGEKPSGIETGGSSIRSDAEEKVVSALLDLDMENGVSLIGNISLNDNDIPLRVDFSAKINEIIAGNEQATEGIAARLSLLNSQDIKAWYSGGKLYAEVKGEKFFSDVPDVLPSLVKAVKEDGISQMIKIVRSETENGIYEISLPDYLNNALYPSVVKSGLGTASGEKDFRFNIKLYIPRSTIGKVSLTFKTDLIDAQMSFNVSEEPFSVTETFEGYDKEIKADASAIKSLPKLLKLLNNDLLRAALNSDFENGVAIDGNLYVNDMCVKVKAGFAVSLREMLFDKLSPAEAIKFYASASDKVAFYYENGKAYLNALGYKFVIPAENLFPAEIEIKGDIADFNLDDYFTATKKENGVYDITLGEKIYGALCDALESAGLAGKNNRNDTQISLSLSVPKDKINAAAVSVKTDKTGFKAELSVRGENLAITEDFGDYTSELKMSGLPSEPDGAKLVNMIFNKFTFSLLDFDIEKGIAFTGTAGIGETFIPVKIQAAANISGLISGKTSVKNALTLKMDILQNENVSLIYKNGNVYLDAFGTKYLFRSTETSAEGFMEAILSGGTDKYFRSEYSGDYLILTATDYAKKRVAAKVKELLPEDTEIVQDIIGGDAKAYLYMPSGKLSGISLSVVTANAQAHAKFAVTNEELVVGDLRGYRTKAAAELNADFTLNETYNAKANVRLTANTLANSLQEAISAEVTVVLDKNLKTFIGLSNLMPDLDLPEWFTLIGSADEIKVTLIGGRAYFYLLEGGSAPENAILAQEIELPTFGFNTAFFGESGSASLTEKIAAIIGSETADVSSIIALLSEIVTITTEGDVVTITLSEKIVKSISDNLWAYLPEKIFRSQGSSMVLAVNMFELHKPLCGIGVTIDKATGSAALYADVYDLGAKEVFVAGKQYETTRMAYLTLNGITNGNFEITTDLYAIARNASAANKVIDKIESLREVRLTEEYLSELESAKANYEALTEAQKKLVYNYKTKTLLSSKETLATLKSQYEKDKKAADKFLTDISKSNAKILNLAKTFDKFTAEQVNYLTRTNAEAIKNFRAKRVGLEASSALEVTQAINALESADLSNLSADELLQKLTELNGIYTKYVSLEKGSIENEKTLIGEIEKTAAAYAAKVRSLAENYLSTFKGMNTDYCALTVAEMNALYEKTSAFDKTYYETPSKLAVYSFVTEADEELKSLCYCVTYYTTDNRAGFRSGAACAANEAIEKLLSGETKESEETVTAIKTLISHTDEKAITRYEEFNTLTKKIRVDIRVFFTEILLLQFVSAPPQSNALLF